MEQKEARNLRILDIYTRLAEGRVLNKAEEAKRFGINERTLQRDIDDIRAFLDERRISNANELREVKFDRIQKGYVMRGNEGAIMTNGEILAVSKILLESRAFTKAEIDGILDKMVQGCVSYKNLKLVNELLANEKFHYVEPRHGEWIQDKVWELGNHVKNYNLLKIQYHRIHPVDQDVTRIIEPIAILFSEYYFYLNGFIVEQDERGRYVHKFEYPAVFRIDRITGYEPLGEKFKIDRAVRFEEGEFRKRTQFMYPGKLMNVSFRFLGSNPEAILDRLPTAEIESIDENGYLIKAQVYGKGIIMWFLSQGANVEVLEPRGLREEMQSLLKCIITLYEECGRNR